ncbi:MAG: DUF4394 domain-containing protein [Planctomycetales bacterium]|nr:DUF4394 domain-containing protein [Planctomycetales bacterium]
MKRLSIALLLGAGFACASTPSSAALIFGVADSSGQTLISFDSSAPGALATGVAISGLQSNETVKGIDFRPANNQLYALGSTNRLYILNPVTGVAAQIGAGPFAPALSGSNFGFDFNPAIDRIRVVSNTKKNYVLNPDTGTATGATDLAFGAGDPNFGVSPNVEFSAYTNSVNPAPAATQLYGIDTGLDILVTQANSAGTLGTVGPLGVNVGAVGGFDITTAGLTNTAYAALLPTSTSASNLYEINLVTGLATNLGSIDGGLVVSSLAIAPDGFDPNDYVPEPASMTLLGMAVVCLVGRKIRG